MKSISRRHHYVSEFYLNGFTKTSKNKEFLQVFDLKEKKHFETTPDRVAVIRDFNRLNVENIEPDILEKIISKLETKAAKVIREINQTLTIPKGEDLEILFNLIALFACRNPIQRDMINTYISEISNRMLDKVYDSKEHWEAFNNEIRKNGGNIDSNADFAEFKKIVTSKKLNFEASKNFMFNLDMASMDAILSTLHHRKWTLISNSYQLNPFISSDKPIILRWDNNFRTHYPPGFAMPNTELLFPLSKSLILLGTFKEYPSLIKANQAKVLRINSKMIKNTPRFIFSPIVDFKYFSKSYDTLFGINLFRSFSMHNF